MEFTWKYQHQVPRCLRSALRMEGVTRSLLKEAI